MLQPFGTVFNHSGVRLGRLTLSGLAFRRMQEHQLSTEILEEVFRYGKLVEENKIILTYDTYEVGILYVLDETRITRGNLDAELFVIITCWKGVKRR